MFLILKYYYTFVPFLAILMHKLFFIFLFVSLSFLSTSYGQNADTIMPSNGAYKSYYKSGKIQEKGHFKNSLKKGVWYFYNERGLLLKKEKYVEGKLQWQLFFERGKIIKIIDKNGRVTERSKCGC